MEVFLEKKKILLVEGNEDERFLKAFFEKEIESVQIIDCGGKPGILGTLAILPFQNGFEELDSIGIIADADNGREKTFDLIKKHLEKNKAKNQRKFIAVPQKIEEFTKEYPSVGVFVFHGFNGNGELEDLCLEVFSTAYSSITDCVDKFFACVSEKNTITPKVTKAKLRTCLAVTDLWSLGTAIKHKKIDVHHNAFTPLKQFIKNLMM